MKFNLDGNEYEFNVNREIIRVNGKKVINAIYDDSITLSILKLEDGSQVEIHPIDESDNIDRVINELY
jgi:hypothetical protein